MKAKDFCDLFSIDCTKELVKNEKFKKLIQYINKNHIEYLYNEEKVMSTQRFITFLEEIKSVSLAAELIKDYKDLTAIGINPKMVAKYYNVYPKNYFYYPGSYMADILTDDNYLKLATIDWTKEHIFDGNYDKILVIKKDGILVKENKSKDMPSMHQNIEALYQAREKGILKEAIESLN